MQSCASDPAALGLAPPWFYWGNRPTKLLRMDIGDHIGWIDAASIEVRRASGIRLTNEEWEALERAAGIAEP